MSYLSITYKNTFSWKWKHRAGSIFNILLLNCITVNYHFLKEKNLRNLCMLLCIAISVASTKRTGTIALILGILVMLVLDAHIQGSLREKWKKYMYLLLLFV